jgi:hypothetical protein
MCQERLLGIAELKSIREIEDPRERARLAHAHIGELTLEAAETSRIRREALSDAISHQGASRVEMAEFLGVSRERIRQILTEGPAPERALLAPAAGPVAVALVQKRDPDSGQPTIGTTTRKAVDALRAAARVMDLETVEEEIAPPGIIDLNRSNLAVLIGPRMSALIAQAISADPVIQWAKDKGGHWYITDARTGKEFHSDYDGGWTARPGGPGRACVAHIGRIRRPDGKGTFLYLGGAHSPGTAGAVEFFVREMPSLWEQVKRSPSWSAVVRTVTAADGSPADTRLITPVYTHGKAA